MPPPCFLSTHLLLLLFLLFTSILHSLWFRLCGDSPEPISCISCQARIRHWREEAGRVRYLTAWASWLGIYADDDSYCPPAILLLPLRWSVYSSKIHLITILLWSTFSFCFAHSPSLPLFLTSGSQLSQKDILQTFCLPFFRLLSKLYCLNRAKDKEKSWIHYFDVRNNKVWPCWKGKGSL